MHKSAIFFIALCAAALGDIQSADAATLNVDINGHNIGKAAGGTYYSDSSANPVAPGGGGLWNGLDITDTGNGAGVNGTYTSNSATNTTGTPTASTGNFEYNDGSASPITLTLAGFNSADNNISNNNVTNSLLQDYLIQTGNRTLTLNFVPAGTYNLFVFGTNGRAGVGGTFTVAGNTLSTANSNSSTTPFILGTDYVEFTNLTVPSGGGPIVITAGNAPTLGVGVTNGFQLVSTPEPSAIALVGLGAMLLIRRRPSCKA